MDKKFKFLLIFKNFDSENYKKFIEGNINIKLIL